MVHLTGAREQRQEQDSWRVARQQELFARRGAVRGEVERHVCCQSRNLKRIQRKMCGSIHCLEHAMFGASHETSGTARLMLILTGALVGVWALNRTLLVEEISILVTSICFWFVNLRRQRLSMHPYNTVLCLSFFA